MTYLVATGYAATVDEHRCIVTRRTVIGGWLRWLVGLGPYIVQAHSQQGFQWTGKCPGRIRVGDAVVVTVNTAADGSMTTECRKA